MFADFDLSSLRPFIIIGVVIIAALLKAFGKQKDDLGQPWETTGFPEESEGHKVIGRHPRREVTTAVPPRSSPAARGDHRGPSAVAITAVAPADGLGT